MKTLLLFLALAFSAAAQTIAVTSLSCDKTAFTKHGDTSTCTATVTNNSGSGGAITPYSVDAPAVLSPAPASGTVTVSFGGLKWPFSLPASLPLPPGATSVTFTVTWP